MPDPDSDAFAVPRDVVMAVLGGAEGVPRGVTMKTTTTTTRRRTARTLRRTAATTRRSFRAPEVVSGGALGSGFGPPVEPAGPRRG